MSLSLICQPAFLLALLASLPAGALGPRRAALACQEPLSAQDAGDAETLREEHFALTQGGRPVGLASFRRAEARDGVQLELELEFPEHDLRLREVLRREAGRATYVWREIRPRAGRTLLGRVDEETDPTALDVREWGEQAGNSRLIAGAAVAFLPDLIERARAGHAGPVVWLDPLGRSLERGSLSDPQEQDADPGVRTWRLLRADGGPEWTLIFRGESLESIAWGAAGLRAEALPVDEYRHRKEALAPEDGTDGAPPVAKREPPAGEIAASMGPRSPRARSPR